MLIWRKKDVLSCTLQHVCLCYLTKRTGSFVVRPSRSWRSNLEIPDILIWQFLLLTFIHALYLIQIFRCLYSKYNFRLSMVLLLHLWTCVSRILVKMKYSLQSWNYFSNAEKLHMYLHTYCTFYCHHFVAKIPWNQRIFY